MNPNKNPKRKLRHSRIKIVSDPLLKKVTIGAFKRSIVRRPPIKSPIGPLVRRPDRERRHIDFIEARRYCQLHGKTLKELTPDEMKSFEKEANSVRF